MRSRRTWVVIGIVLFISCALFGQAANEQGIKPYGSYEGSDIDQINVSNGHLELRIPLLEYAQRGGHLKLSFIARYHNSVWNEKTDCAQGGPVLCLHDWFPDQPSGIVVIPEQAPPPGIDQQLISGGNTQNPVYAYALRLSDESEHPLGNTSGTLYETLDATGMRWDSASEAVTLSDGSRYPNITSSPATLEDTNGNQITFHYGGIDPNSTIIDTMGRSVPWPGGSGATQDFSGCTGSLPTSAAALWTVPGANNSLNTFKLCYAQVFIYTAHWGGRQNTPTQQYFEANGYYTKIQSIVLPDGTAWTFDYSQPVNGINWGDLVKITLPTGGTISYDWSHNDGCHAGFGSPGIRTSEIDQRILDAQDSTGPHAWTYSGGILAGQVKVTDPLGNDTVHTFTDLNSSCSFYETKTEFYAGSQSGNKILKTLATTYSWNVNPNIPANFFGGPSPVINVVPTSKTASWLSGKSATTAYTYDSGFPFNNSTATGIYGKEKSESEYDYNGALLRSTATSYLWEQPTASSYITYNILDVPLIVTLSNSVGTVAQTFYGYDGPAPQSSGIITSLDTNPVNGLTRGNVTSVGKLLTGSAVSTPTCPVAVTNGNVFIQSMTYLDTGMVSQSKDACSIHQTSLQYSSTFAGAYATSSCDALNHCTTSDYDFNTGLTTRLTDSNNASTTTVYDNLGRVESINRPDGGQTQAFYPDPRTVEVKKLIDLNAGKWIDTYFYFDGLLRPFETRLVDPEGDVYTLTAFDPLGRKDKVFNPTRCNPPDTKCSETTWGYTQFTYDALDRTIATAAQDGSVTLADNSQFPIVTVTDPSGNARRSRTDALGRLVEVDEPGGAKSNGVQATTSITISGPFNSAWIPAGTPHLAEVGTSLASVVMTDGSSHEFYFDLDQHLCQVSRPSGSSWANQDLTEMAGADGPAMIGSSLTAVVVGGFVHVFYQGANLHLYDMEWDGGVWQNLDMTILTGASPASGTKMSAFAAPGNVNSPMVFYEGTDQHLYTAYWNTSAAAWQNADLHALSGATVLMAPNAALGSAYFTVNGGIYVFFIGTDQHIICINWANAWLWGDIGAWSGSALAANGSDVTTIATGTTIDLMSFYESADQHLHSIYWNGTTNVWTWQTLDMTAFSSATNVAWPLSSLANNNAGPYSFYFGSNQHLYAMFYNGSLNAWVNNDLTLLSGADVVPAAGSSLSSHATSAGNLFNLFFVGPDQHIYHTYSANGSTWANEDTSATASNQLMDSGVVLLTIPNGSSSFVATVCYGESTNSTCAGKPVNTSPGDIANALAAVLNGSGSPVNAAANGPTLSLTWRTSGYNIESVPSITSISDNPSLFPGGSFSSSEGTFSGGLNVGGQTLTTSMVTLYSYDALGNLYCVEQHGDAPTGTGCPAAPYLATSQPVQPDPNNPWRRRLFAYDSLSRLVWASNPESGVSTYSYNADGNLLQKTSPAPNQTGAAKQTISYCYDVVGRVSGKSYNAQNCPLTSPVVTYSYDAGANAIGRLSSLTDQAGSGSYAYDSVGHMTAETRIIAGISKNMAYSYYAEGSVKTITYPSNRVVTYTPDAAGRTVSAIDSNGTQYVTSATYWPNGAEYQRHMPVVYFSTTLNPRLQVSAFYSDNGQVPSFFLDKSYYYGPAHYDNGNVLSIINNKDTSRTQTFTYDSLNRITSAQNAGTNCAATTVNGETEYWGNSYSYDAWGNLLNKSVTKCGAENLAVTALGNNQLSGYGYDAAGNMTADPTDNVAPVYEQENRITGANGYTYTYDADGNRVEKSNGTIGTIYWAMSAGIMGESDLAGNPQSEYIFFNGKRTVRIDVPTNNVHYYLSDALNSTSMVVSAAGAIENESDYYPWGGELQLVDNDSSNHYKFTGKERDSESGLDNFGARYNASNMGRFMSPDPDQVSGFLYPDDPQAWNGYSYARNNPLTLIDPDGEAFQYCQSDKDGKPINCSNVTDEQHQKDVKEGVNTFKDGKIFDGDKVIGTFKDLGPDIPGDPEANRQAAAMIVNTFDSAMKEFGKNAAYAATGTIALRGLGVAAEAVGELGLFKNTKVVINWAHNLSAVRPGHIPPPGSAAEITSAVEGAVQTGSYTMKAGGLIEGTTTIQGVTVGFRGRMIDGVARIATVFTKR